MPIAPSELFSKAGLAIAGTVPWGAVPPTKSPGVYAISLCSDSSCNGGLLSDAPVDHDKVRGWIDRVPTIKFRGEAAPCARVVTTFLQTFWLRDESIIYIGKATSLRKRLGDFYRHVLGDRSPHCGGHWLKTLSVRTSLFIHFCCTATVAEAGDREVALLSFFKEQVAILDRQRQRNPIPFGNREHPKGVRKQTDISQDVLR